MAKAIVTLGTVALIVGTGEAGAQPVETDGYLWRMPVEQQHHRIGDPLPIRIGIKASPSSPPAPAPVAYAGADRLTPEAVETLARRAGFGELAPTMVEIAERESGLCPRAVYGQGCIGTFVEGGPACSLYQLFPCPGPEAADPMAATWLARQKCLGAIASGGGCLDPWGGDPTP